MTTINDGGPAFPMSYDNSLAYTYPSHKGMTLRDWFAGQALAGLLSQSHYWPPHKAADEAIEHANALIERLDKEVQP